jgi:hypothetical protein
MSKNYSEQEIRQMCNIEGNIYYDTPLNVSLPY